MWIEQGWMLEHMFVDCGAAGDICPGAAAERPFFFDASEHADGERRGPIAGPKEPKDASRRDLSEAAL